MVITGGSSNTSVNSFKNDMSLTSQQNWTLLMDGSTLLFIDNNNNNNNNNNHHDNICSDNTNITINNVLSFSDMDSLTYNSQEDLVAGARYVGEDFVPELGGDITDLMMLDASVFTNSGATDMHMKEKEYAEERVSIPATVLELGPVEEDSEMQLEQSHPSCFDLDSSASVGTDFTAMPSSSSAVSSSPFLTSTSADVLLNLPASPTQSQPICTPVYHSLEPPAASSFQTTQIILTEPSTSTAPLQITLPSNLNHPPETPSSVSDDVSSSPSDVSTPGNASVTSDTQFVFPPPRTPSNFSDDVSSSSYSDVSTPGISGVTSGTQFLLPIPGDAKMAAATMEALETNSLTPLIKEELKYTIQSRRLAAGKPELVVDASRPVKRSRVMTEEERARYVKRREQNRVAAQKFRQKQKDTEEILSKKCRKLEGSNSSLRTEIKRLARETKELQELLNSHLPVCHKPAKSTP